GRLLCLQGECRLLALDIESGRVLWQCWSPAARLGTNLPGACFSPHYLATADRVLIQSAGSCRLLDARTGSVVPDLPPEPTPAAPRGVTRRCPSAPRAPSWSTAGGSSRRLTCPPARSPGSIRCRGHRPSAASPRCSSGTPTRCSSSCRTTPATPFSASTPRPA